MTNFKFSVGDGVVFTTEGRIILRYMVDSGIEYLVRYKTPIGSKTEVWFEESELQFLGSAKATGGAR